VELALPLPIRGMVIGFTIASAVGPITLLVIRRTIDHGRLYGIVSGVGVATADASYAAIAAFGLTAITGVLVSIHALLGIVGGAVIILIGVRTVLSRPKGPASDAERPGLASAFGSIYGLTLTNPLTIVLFAGIFAGIGLAAGSSFVDAALLTVAVLAGSSLWWLILCSAVAAVRGRVSPTALLWVNRASGTMLVVFGALSVIAVLRP
jgi:threonine/homoserine/homoserine lactone efflux protein